MQHLKHRVFSLIAIFSLLSCGEDSYDIEMLAYDFEADEIVTKVNTVKTLDDLGKLEGRATRLRGGLSIELDQISGMVRWNRVGTPVAFNALEIDNVYHPTDYNSLAMVSVYYNIEAIMLYMEALGMPKGKLGRIDTYYWADVTDIYSSGMGTVVKEKSTNNAFYLSLSQRDRGFYILPFDLSPKLLSQVDRVPLSMNPGVIAHEYSHAVFQELVLDSLPKGGVELAITPYNYLWALNEGIADIFAVASTGDTDFITASISDPTARRDALDVVEYKFSYDSNIRNKGTYFDDPYEIGQFFSATIYEIARRFQGLAPNGLTKADAPARREVARITYKALSALPKFGIHNFRPADFFTVFVSHVGPGRHETVCQVLSERFQIHYTEVEGCL